MSEDTPNTPHIEKIIELGDALLRCRAATKGGKDQAYLITMQEGFDALVASHWGTNPARQPSTAP